MVKGEVPLEKVCLLEFLSHGVDWSLETHQHLKELLCITKTLRSNLFRVQELESFGASNHCEQEPSLEDHLAVNSGPNTRKRKNSQEVEPNPHNPYGCLPREQDKHLSATGKQCWTVFQNYSCPWLIFSFAYSIVWGLWVRRKLILKSLNLEGQYSGNHTLIRLM